MTIHTRIRSLFGSLLYNVVLSEWFDRTGRVIAFLFMSALVAVVAWPFLLDLLWVHVEKNLSTTAGRTFLFVLLLILSVILYLVRKLFRGEYGIGEIGFGMATSWVALTKANEQAFASVTALAVAVYVIVRGLDNAFEGKADWFTVKEIVEDSFLYSSDIVSRVLRFHRANTVRRIKERRPRR
jgi:hypothetical protein